MRRILLAFGVLVTVAAWWMLVPFVRAYRNERRVLHPPAGPVTLADADARLGLQPLTIRQGTTRIAAWYAPPTQGGTVILVGGTGSTRGTLLPEARALIGAGHGVVLFDWPGHGESTGSVDLGAGAQRALQAVLDSTATLRGTVSTRIGLCAFSFGGVAALMLARRDPRVRALLLAGTPIDAEAQMAYEYRKHGRFALAGARWFWRQHGDPLPALRLDSAAAGLARRAVLLIAGERDDVVDPADARRFAELIGASADVWRIAGAGHGDYEAAAPEYPERLGAFFTRTLAVPGPH
ncbi:MAG: alpha/beta hydrolase [Gemmatimonadota bacterium]